MEVEDSSESSDSDDDQYHHDDNDDDQDQDIFDREVLSMILGGQRNNEGPGVKVVIREYLTEDVNGNIEGGRRGQAEESLDRYIAELLRDNIFNNGNEEEQRTNNSNAENNSYHERHNRTDENIEETDNRNDDCHHRIGDGNNERHVEIDMSNEERKNNNNRRYVGTDERNKRNNERYVGIDEEKEYRNNLNIERHQGLDEENERKNNRNNAVIDEIKDKFDEWGNMNDETRNRIYDKNNDRDYGIGEENDVRQDEIESSTEERYNTDHERNYVGLDGSNKSDEENNGNEEIDGTEVQNRDRNDDYCSRFDESSDGEERGDSDRDNGTVDPANGLAVRAQAIKDDSDSDFYGFSPVSDIFLDIIRNKSSGDNEEVKSRETTHEKNSPLYGPDPSPKEPAGPLIVASYGISAHEKILVQKYCYAYGFEYTDSCSKAYSILVFKGTSTVNNSSFKYLVALAAKAKIVNYEWVLHSLRENRALPEENFLLRDLSFSDPNSNGITSRIFRGVNVVTELLSGLHYHEPQAVEHLFNLIGAKVIKSSQDLRKYRYRSNKFILFLDEKQLDARILNQCARYSTLAVNFKWVQDSLRHGRRLPVEDYLSFTFPLTDETLGLYGIEQGEEYL